MSDREYCKDCIHCKKLREHYICDVATPYWVDSPPIILSNINMAVTCNTHEPVLTLEAKEIK